MSRWIVLGLVAVLATGGPALAKSAICYTSDDGEYECEFEGTDENGSFEIRAEGYPSFRIEIDSPGIGYGYGQFSPDGDFTPLPGQYIRSEEDPACWENADTQTEICAW